jgi:hypothetical protein
MLISRPLLDSYTAAIRDDHPKWGLELVPEEVAAARQKLLSTAVGLVPDDAVLPIYPYTKDRGDNIALHTAIVGGAEFLVTQKSDLYEDPSFGRRWEHESGRSVLAVTFDRIADMITTLSSANGERRTQTAASRGSVPPTRPTRERAP